MVNIIRPILKFITVKRKERVHGRRRERGNVLRMRRCNADKIGKLIKIRIGTAVMTIAEMFDNPLALLNRGIGIDEDRVSGFNTDNEHLIISLIERVSKSNDVIVTHI